MKYILSCLIIMLTVACNDKKEDIKKDNDRSNVTINTTPPSKNDRSGVNPYALVDVSPMDMSYFPVDYPKLKMAKATTASPLARVIYSRPHLQGRHIFHEVLKYEEPWRLGANEATELELFADATIQGKKIKAGRYVLYCIPHTASWTVVLNTNTDTWGLEPDTAKDVARFEMPVVITKNSLEYFTIVFEKKDAGAELVMAWDDAEVRLPVTF
ncbi:MAG: DUF2911 domain-containing protein [Chitinophagaceae bacterium]|nr:DUF2911 domain-containing protein [Chitinophagaceae bacterium]